MKNKNQRIIIEVALFCALIFLVYREISNRQKITNLTQNLTDNSSLLYERGGIINEKTDSIKKYKLIERKFNQLEISISDRDYLKELGIKDPETELLNDLKKQKNIIPYKGILGGTMKIRNILVINRKWAVAYFEDGHVGGKLMLEYKIKNDAKIEWKLIDSWID